jgi:basic amino acid/polyamine antiporter, APA family
VTVLPPVDGVAPSRPALLPRRLGAGSLLVLGIGNILGAGVYVMTGTAAAQYAGPAVMASFVIAAIACALVGLCYAELASRHPQSGSAYSYCRANFGTGMAWSLGWLLLLEYSLSASMLALGFVGYLDSLLRGFGAGLPAMLSTPLVTASMVHGVTTLEFGPRLNVFAALAAMAAAAVMALGIGKSMLVNTLLVVIKITVLLVFIVVGATAIDPAHWHPFVPANEGNFMYGWQGVARAASMLFFAYLGFETVSTAAAETHNPNRDVPIGILGSLGVCTLLYIAAAAVLTGLVPFRELGVPDPIAVAVDHMGRPGLAIVIKLGALTGLASVLLANAYGQSRICFAIAADRLLPPLFLRRHPRSGSLWQANLVLGAVAATGAALLPVSLLGDMVSLGVTCCFVIVALTLIKTRSRGTDDSPGFRVPFGGIRVRGIWLGTVPVLAIVTSVVMVLPVVIDIGGRALHGDVVPALMLSGYLLLGVVIYFLYGRPRAAAHAMEPL